MESAYRGFLELLKKFPFGEKLIEHSWGFVGGSYLVWVVLVLIAIIGLALGLKYKQIRTWAGFFLLAVFVGLISYFFFRLFTKYQ